MSVWSSTLGASTMPLRHTSDDLVRTLFVMCVIAQLVRECA